MRKVLSTLLTALLMMTVQNALANKVGDSYTLPGIYTMSIDDDYSDAKTGKQDITVQIAPTEDGKYAVTELETEYFRGVIPFDFNDATNTISFQSKVDLGNGYYFATYTTDRWGDPYFDRTYTLTFDTATGEITFPDYACLAWIEEDAIDYDEWSIGYYMTRYTAISLKQTGDLEEEEDKGPLWIDLGDATLMDGWVLPMLGIDQTKQENWYKVPLQQNRDDEHLYRLVNPYMVGPAAEANIHATKEGYIEFNISDPEHVLFNKVEAGFAYNDARDGEKKFNQFYCMNDLGATALRYSNYEISQIIQLMGKDIIFTTYEDGVVTLGADLLDNRFGDGSLSYDARYGTESKPDCNGIWWNNNDRPINMSARIYFPDAELPEEPAEPEDPNAVKGTATYALAVDETHTAGETVEVKNEDDEVVATLTFGFAGEADYKPATANAANASLGMVAFTEGNGENGKKEGNQGTAYIIKPKYNGSVTVGVVINADKPLWILEDGVALEEYSGKTETEKYYGAYEFDVKGGSEYVVTCQGSKLGFYGFNYAYEDVIKEEPVVVAAPVFNPEDGATVAPYDVIEITAEEGCDIYWMIEGYDEDFVEYVADEAIVPRDATESITVKAYAQKDDVQSDVVTVTYTIGKNDPMLEWILNGETVTEVTVDMGDEEPALPNLDGIIEGGVEFTSSDEKVATIDEEGGIKLVAAGKTTITAKSNETVTFKAAEASFELTVTDTKSGIIGVSVDGASVRYYNLQGVEVSAPAAGQTYIKVSGNQAAKVIVK